MSVPPPEALSLLGIGCVTVWSLARLLRAHRAGTLRGPSTA